MYSLASVALFGWLPVSLVLFAWLPARRAAILSFVLGWMFLPVASYPIPGLPDYTKTSAISFAVLASALLFDSARVRSVRPRWVDLPVLLWCLCPFASSLSNGLGAYDGLAVMTDHAITWGMPYFIGRVYCTDLTGLRALALGFLIGGILYVPLCLFEMANGPVLHMHIYGSFAQPPLEAFRFGGWRPVVFMQHGLMIALWMVAASVCGLWLWRTGALHGWRRWRPGWWVLGLLLTTVFLKSANGWGLLAAGAGVLWLVKRFRTSLPLLCITVAAPLYILLRSSGAWTGEQLIPLATRTVGAERAQSLTYRLRIESRGARKARQRPVFGWGRWGRSFLYDIYEQRFLPFDSLWMIALGQTGFAGLLSLLLLLSVPVVVLRLHYPPALWAEPSVAPAFALALVLALYAADCCFNAMLNPLYMLVAGGLSGVTGEDAEAGGNADAMA